MMKLLSVLAELAAAAGIFLLWYQVLWKRFGKKLRTVVLLLFFCALFASFSGENIFSMHKRTVTITALGEKSEYAENTQIYLVDVQIDGESQGIPQPTVGQWIWYQGRYCWFEEDDERFQPGTTQSVTFELQVAQGEELIFASNKWKGLVELQADGVKNTVDTGTDSEEGRELRVSLPEPSAVQLGLAAISPVLGFSVVLMLLCGCLSFAVILERIFETHLAHRLVDYGWFQKILQYKFLFEELVSRDFKKKYKRTALGMAWSILSPLFTLLVMRIVFTQFFGRDMEHYTTYLFCGNLVFSYFNEATSQGMTSLMENSGIFTKVNVPKYLFLFSKNVQTLINFGLTLCVFFAFCAIDQITFTWKFVFLLYPICFLVLFNIGTGLILSALFVFFRDIQYLWAVFTQLLMYMSAIFYTIDQYSYEVQCAFLINPVYLFIRYFRKIVIESTIPTVWFHLLMLVDALVALGIGCEMYKKYNTKFLYYI